MAHPAQFAFVGRVRGLFPRHFSGARVLEVGSLDINGTIRSLFRECDYTGIDIAPGRGVDLVCDAQDYDAPDGSFDTVISCEAMEHNPHWSATFANMVRLCRHDGLIVMTCALAGRPEHGTARSDPDASPLTVAKGWGHYRNLRPRDFVAAGLLEPLAMREFFENWPVNDLYFLGAKRAADPDLARALAAMRRRYRRATFLTPRGLKHFLLTNLLPRE